MPGGTVHNHFGFHKYLPMYCIMKVHVVGSIGYMNVQPVGIHTYAIRYDDFEKYVNFWQPFEMIVNPQQLFTGLACNAGYSTKS